MSQSSDGRRFPRLVARHAVLVRELAHDGLEEIAPTKTIAMGGCCLVTDHGYGVETPVELLISVDHQVIRARGRVVYEHPAADGRMEVGIEFVQLEDDAAAAIRLLFEAGTRE